MNKVLCPADKSSIMWANPHNRSSAEEFSQTQANIRLVIIGQSNMHYIFDFCPLQAGRIRKYHS